MFLALGFNTFFLLLSLEEQFKSEWIASKPELLMHYVTEIEIVLSRFSFFAKKHFFLFHRHFSSLHYKAFFCSDISQRVRRYKSLSPKSNTFTVVKLYCGVQVDFDFEY